MELRIHDENVTLTLSPDETKAVLSSLNEIVGGVHISEDEFETRVGYPKSYVRLLLDDLVEKFRVVKSLR